MRKLKHWLKAYMNFTRASESPDAFHFWTGVGTIAGALRRRVWLDMRHFQWTPNIYIILVGPPGVANKSTTVRIGSSLLSQVDGIHFGPQSMTWAILNPNYPPAMVQRRRPSGFIEPCLPSKEPSFT